MLNYVKKLPALMFSNPPMTMACLAILVCLIPSLQNYFKMKDFIIYKIVTKSLMILGDVTPPFNLLILGANLASTGISSV